MPRETRVLVFSEEELIWAIHNLAAQSDVLDLPDDIAKVVPFEDHKDGTVSVGLEFAGDRYSVMNDSQLGAALILHCVRVGVPMPKNADKKLRVNDGHVELVITIGDKNEPARKTPQAAAKEDVKPEADGLETDPRITSMLADWMVNREEGELVAPWRISNDPWLVLMGMCLFSEASPQVIRGAWPVYRERWPQPAKFLADSRRRAALGALNKATALRSLTLAARVLSRGELSAAVVEEEFGDIPRSVSRTAFGLSGKTELRVPGPGIVRVASRVFGVEPSKGDEFDEGEQQRLVDCLVAEDPSGRAFGAALEIADQFCHESRYTCADCPLSGDCASSTTAGAGSEAKVAAAG